MRDRVLELLEQFRQRLRGDGAAIAARTHRIATLDADERTALARQLHTIKGSSGSMGFAEIHRLAAGLEAMIHDCEDRTVTDRDADEIRARTDALTEAIARLDIRDSTLHAQFA